jgi:hypothetical protein
MRALWKPDVAFFDALASCAWHAVCLVHPPSDTRDFNQRMGYLVGAGLNPADWPTQLLGALRDRALPPLDLSHLPERSIAGHAVGNATTE